MRNPPKVKKNQTPVIDTSKLAAAIKKEFGDGVVNVPGKDSDYMLRKISHWIDVGRFNAVFGHEAFGIPCGYYSELAGNESAGKSTLALCIIAWAQQQSYVTWLADIEHSFDTDWAIKQGVDTDQLMIIEAAFEKGKKFNVDNVDQQFEKYEAFIRQAHEKIRRPQLLVVDSLAALLPREQLEGDYGERSVGALARALAVNLPKFHTALLETQTACLFINQVRDKIGVLFGDKETTPGGRAKNFYFSARASIKKVKTVITGGKPAGIISKIKNRKNKIDAPFREVEFEINFKTGIV